jgi:hypothetical protein
MTTAAQGDPPRPTPLLGPVLGTLPADLSHREVLGRLGPKDLASLAGAGRECAAAVAATALMRWAKLTKMTAPGYIQPLCVQSACSHACHCGNREVLEWLRNTGCPWDSQTCARAAGCGYLEVLQWARQHHCPWNWWTPALAAEGGQLEVLHWIRENDTTGEVWDEDDVRQFAGGSRKHEVLTWLDGLSAP